MAKNTSFVKLEGTLDGLTFYRQKGESLVKTKNRVSKNRILHDPAYKRTRENMQEFGGAIMVTKALRSAFSGIVRTMTDSYFTGRVNRLMKRVNDTGAGRRGERDYNLVDNATLFRSFEFNAELPFSTQFFAPYDAPVITAGRDGATWTVPDFNTDLYVVKPEGATHMRLVLAGGFVSNYEYVIATKLYEPDDAQFDGIGTVSYSPEIALTGMVGSDTVLNIDLSSFGAPPVTSLLFVAVGILFYQEINGEFYELSQGNCMKVAVTG